MFFFVVVVFSYAEGSGLIFFDDMDTTIGKCDVFFSLIRCARPAEKNCSHSQDIAVECSNSREYDVLATGVWVSKFLPKISMAKQSYNIMEVLKKQLHHTYVPLYSSSSIAYGHTVCD